MAQIGKASSKRGKPSYVMSIIGVTLVLFLLGIVGWLVLNASKLGDQIKGNVEVRAFLRGDVTAKDSAALMQEIAAKPYVREAKYVDKEAAREIYLKGEGESARKSWEVVLDANPLPNAVFFYVKNEFVQLDSLRRIETDLKQNAFITEIKYPEAVVSNLDDNIRKISLGLLVVALIIAVSVIFLIDNTIRLAMFSNRFLIKTMQMVGATRQFISRPLATRAIINGAISAAIAIVLIYILISVAEGFIPWLGQVRSSGTLLLLFLLLMIIGISITLFSTWRSVSKYLRMKLDELY
ncbi:MAG TPA: permease-like cell division protein FtsX [Flavisolibacter sp.]|jgi:cell division transport system permease protein|nr:permease-like cell division protein FtsX [Flavisolibacter sp.]